MYNPPSPSSLYTKKRSYKLLGHVKIYCGGRWREMEEKILNVSSILIINEMFLFDILLNNFILKLLFNFP